MPTENDNKVLGVNSIPYIKGYILNAVKYSEDRISEDLNEKMNELLKKYSYFLGIIEDLHGSLEFIRLDTKMFSELEGKPGHLAESEDTKDIYLVLG